ncbi:PadR family transcriptional regulator [Mycobacterium gordonae]|uniref:helix-turn-helix transcriptional regulator n=1 Tax=Mycobacterium gordonae TaxID=1778 RepID=UPI00210942AF|nr:helix-turn-helix transcriptional regulator [Mycobacterium gordonae]MBX9981248.1 PadR family transcriptional regulator [Mycobacterium gordonae]MCQ4361966.1 PadR family transcriptional regulator [Mycobacterium gordonae]
MTAVLPAEVRLHALHHAAMAPIHSAWMAAELVRHGYRLSPEMLRTVMYRMEIENLLVPERDFVDGRLRRVYAITARGIWALKRPEFVLGLGAIKIDP